MHYESLGHMPRAPLVYSLAMIEYAPVPAIADYADSIMERLRGDYPDIGKLNLAALKIDVDAATGESRAHQQVSIQWRMNNPESNLGLVFGSDRLVVHTTAYEHFAGFAEKVKEIASVVSEVANIKFSKNIGIRHIDNICQIDDFGLEQLLKKGYLCPSQNEGLTPFNSRVEFIYTSEIGRLFVRAYQISNHPKVPQDLFPLAGELGHDAQLLVPISDAFVLTDTDHIYSPSKLESFNIERIIEILDLLHRQCSLGFRAMVTDEAIEAWRKEGD